MARSPEARRDLASAAGLAILAVAYLLVNRTHPLDTLATPGPGVFPLAVGVLMLGVAAGQAVAAARARPTVPPSATEPDPREGSSRRRGLALTAVLIGYPIAAGMIGFLTASFAVVLASSRLLGAHGWLRPGALALGVIAAVYVIFAVWLGVPLPAGPLP